MFEPIGRDRLLELLVAGTPDRVLDAMVALSPDDADDLRALRELFATGLGAPAVVPPASLRERLLASRPKARRPQRPVLLVLDMIQDYLTPGRPLEVPRARDIVPALKRHLEDARARKVPVVYVCDTHPADDPDFRDWPRHAVEGTPGSDVWPEIAPLEGDLVIRKRTYSAFHGSTLADTLDELGADSLILTGCATEIGIAATASDALQRGFVVTIPPDAQAGGSVLTEQAALLTLQTMMPFEPRYLAAAAPSVPRGDPAPPRA
jgi:nicotinamidase-related amidase